MAKKTGPATSTSKVAPKALTDPAASQERISGIVRMLLVRRNMRQADLADVLTVDASTMTRILKGERLWKITDLEAMATFFGVSPAVFFLDPDDLFAGFIAVAR